MTTPLGNVNWIDCGICVCGKKIWASQDGIIAVMHEEPRCEKFNKLDPPEFLTYVRKHWYGEIQ